MYRCRCCFAGKDASDQKSSVKKGPIAEVKIDAGAVLRRLPREAPSPQVDISSEQVEQVVKPLLAKAAEAEKAGKLREATLAYKQVCGGKVC